MSTKNIKSLNKKTQGIIYILISAFSFAVMNLFVNLSGDLPVFQKAFFRNLIAAFLAWGMLFRSRSPIKLNKPSIPYLFLRSTFGVIGIVANFYAISNIPIADASILNKLSPFFAIIASLFILHERANWRQWLGVIIALIGALFVVRPAFIFGSTEGVSILPSLVGFGSGIAAGIAYTFVRKASSLGEKSVVIVCFFSTFSVIVLLPPFILSYQPMSVAQFLCLLAAGTFAVGGQLGVTAAYACCPAKEISVYDYSSVIFSAILGLIFLSQVPDMLSIVGYIIIIGASVYSYWINNYVLTKPAK